MVNRKGCEENKVDNKDWATSINKVKYFAKNSYRNFILKCLIAIYKHQQILS